MEARPLYVVEKRANEPPESVVLRLDSTKSYVELGWKPLLTIGEAVSMTVEWHVRYLRDPGAIRQFSQQQIAEYAAAWAVSSESASMPEHRDEGRSMRVNYGQSVYGEEEIAAVVDVLRSSTQMGPRVRLMQERVAALFAKRHGIMVNSGSSANYLAIELLDLPKGAEVITPALTFATTVAPIVRAGLIPVFVDAAEATYNIDVAAIERSISKKTRAVMIPSLIGNLPDWDRIRAIADKHRLKSSSKTAPTRSAQRYAGRAPARGPT